MGFLLIGSLLVAAATQPSEWPQKGDTVYVSATLKNVMVLHPFVFGGPAPESDVPACVPMVIKKARPEKELWDVKDPVGGTERLLGPWPARIHRSDAECRDSLKKLGEPTVVRSGVIHRIMAPAPADLNTAP